MTGEPRPVAAMAGSTALQLGDRYITSPSNWSVHPEADWDAFYRSLLQKTGLDLRQYKPEQLRRKIGKIVQSRALASLKEFWNELDANPAELEWFLDRLAVNVTELFRDPDRWADLRERVLPDLLTRNSRLKCWSAGCSTGAEAYALAITLDAAFRGSHEVLGTDIDNTALAHANRAVFSMAEMRSVPADLLARYFEPFEEGWRAAVKLRRYLRFRRHDLLSTPPGSDFDLIVCRNVGIYLTDEARAALYGRLFHALKPGGYLFVGSTERIFEARDLGYEASLPFFYKRPETDANWRLAA